MKWFWPVSIGSVLSAGVALSLFLGLPASSTARSQQAAARLQSKPALQSADQALPTKPLAAATEAAPSPPTPAWPELPDLLQTDPALGVPGGGTSHCGPVAVSNSLVWLSQHGYPELLPQAPSAAQGGSAGQTDLHARQLELVRQISAEPFMGTSRWSGTGPAGVLRGLHRYVKRHGYRYARLQYQGWRGHQKAFSTGVRRPELAWIRQALDDGGVAFLHVGWYKPVPRSTVLRRTGGHWVSVVAAGVDEQFHEAPMALVVHDPAPYAGDEPERAFVTARELTEGWLLERGSRQAFSAKGYYSLEGGMRIKDEGELAVLDGVVVLVMDATSRKPTQGAAQAEPAHLGVQRAQATAAQATAAQATAAQATE